MVPCRLQKTILKNSVSKIWAEAAREWEIAGCDEDESLRSSCLCGRGHLKYLYTLRNKKNGKTLSPIGGACIKKFGRSDFDEQREIDERLFRLTRAAEENRYISLTPDFFSRKLLKYILEDGAFTPSKYNHYNGENDYDFLLKMFNRKKAPAGREKAKIRAIIVLSIKPYLKKRKEEASCSRLRGAKEENPRP